MVRSKTKIKSRELLEDFASMCQRSRAPDGDWQGDGYGIAWQVNGKWKLEKSLSPIWEEQDKFNQIPAVHLFVAHARSSGFPDQKRIIEFNQPYIHDSLVFVFNGMIRGVNLSIPLEGKIGAQKIFSLLQKVILRSVSDEESRWKLDIHQEQDDKIQPDQALRSVDALILKSAKKLEGMNIGLVHKDKFYILCEYENNPSYFRLRYFRDDNISIVCSEAIDSYEWRIMKKGEILVL